MGVALVKEEVVQGPVQRRAAHVLVTRFGDGFAHLVVVHQAVVNGSGLGVVRDFPDFRQVLERQHKAASRRSVVHGRNARGALAVERGGVETLGQVQVGVKQHGGARQVVGCHDPAAIAADGHVAHVQAGAHFGHHRQVPQVVLGDPAVARAKEHKAPVGRELGAAVQRVAAGKAVDDLEFVAVQHRDMVVAAFDHQKEVHRVGGPRGLGRQIPGASGFHARGADVGVAPGGRGGGRLVNPVDHAGNVGSGHLVGVTGHLRGRAAMLHHAQGVLFAQARQAFGQQRRAHAAGARVAMAAGAVLLVQGGCAEGGRAGRQCRRHGGCGSRDSGSGRRLGLRQLHAHPEQAGAQCQFAGVCQQVAQGLGSGFTHFQPRCGCRSHGARCGS